MFKKSPSAALSLDIAGSTVTFGTPGDLEFALSGKTGPSSARIAALVALSDEALLREADRFGEMHRQVAGALAHSDGNPGPAGDFLRALDASAIADDNDWRDIILALNRLDTRYETYKQAALVKYLEYLVAGREVVNSIYATRRKNRERPAPLVGADRRGAGFSGPDFRGGASGRQLLVYDIPVLALPDGREKRMNRLPKGEPVEVRIAPHQALDLLLARHPFRLVAGEPFLLIDDSGADLRLRPGRNMLGRNPECEVVIDPSYRAVSRRHLLVETGPDDRIRLTDISTLGTFAPLDTLERLLH